MPRISPLAALPKPIHESLVARLRAAAYGELVKTEGWLAEQGHRIGKSSIHRYAVRLRALDAESGDVAASVATYSTVGTARAARPAEGRPVDLEGAKAIRAEIDRLLDRLIDV